MNKKSIIRLLSVGLSIILLIAICPIVAMGAEADGVSVVSGQEDGYMEFGGEPSGAGDAASADNEYPDGEPVNTGSGNPESAPIESENGQSQGWNGEATDGEGWNDESVDDEDWSGEPTYVDDRNGEEDSESELSEPLRSACSGKITLDGSTRDWDAANISSFSVAPGDGMNNKNKKVTGVRVARGLDGTVYVCVEGSANTYDKGDMSNMSILVTQNGSSSFLPFGGFESAYECDANGASYAPFVLELAIPASQFTDPNFIISFNECNFPAQTIPVLDGIEQEEEPEIPVYRGIEIDGRFNDWAAVTRYPAVDPNHCIDQTSMVFDGDSVYIYIHEDQGYASSAGSHSNGMYAINTDLGRALVFQLTPDGSVNGVEGALAQHVGSQWEIRIPASALPYYSETLSFGLYLGESFISNVANLGGGGGNAGFFSGIVIDGQYGDWSAYPHEVIEYATSGTTSQMTDSEGALYVEGSKLYAHVETTMPEHLMSQGGDFLAAISVAFNGDRSFKEYPGGGNFYPCMLDDNGNVSIVNEYTRLPNGTYTFAICDTRSVGTGEDVRIFGTMKVTVNGYHDQMEFELDLEEVADYIGCSVTDLKLIEAQFGRLGQQWLSVAGTSSGPWLGLAICAALPSAAFWTRKRRSVTAV